MSVGFAWVLRGGLWVKAASSGGGPIVNGFFLVLLAHRRGFFSVLGIARIVRVIAFVTKLFVTWALGGCGLPHSSPAPQVLC